MIISHSVFFFHANTNSFLQILAGFGDMVSFTGLLFIAGASSYVSYIHYKHPYSNVIVRLFKRLSMYVLGYYIVSLFASGVWRTGNIGEAFSILTFQKLVPFTEFIVPFILIGLLKVPLRPFFQLTSKSLNLTIIVGALLYFTATVLAFDSISFFGKILLVGSPDSFSFPLINYLPVYLAGLYVGRRFFIHTSHEEVKKFVTTASILLAGIIVIVVSIPFVLSVSPLDMFNRFPPAPAFLLAGLAVSFFFTALLLEFQELKNMPLTRTFLLLLGQNTFAILFAHTALVYLYQFSNLPKVYSPILTGLLFIFSLMTSLYLAKILPFNYSFSLTFINWCECNFRNCKHAHEHSIVKFIKRWFFAIIDIPNVLSVSVGSHKIYLVKKWTVILIGGALLLAVTPLGVAENNSYFQLIIGNTTGVVNKTWVLTTSPLDLVYKLNDIDSLVAGQPDIHVEFQINNEKPIPMKKEGSSYIGKIDTKILQPGEYTIAGIVSLNYAQYKTKSTTFYVSEPLLVSWTIDWEGLDSPDKYIDAMGNIADDFDIPMTQMFNPRYFTSPDISSDRVETLTSWVKKRRDIKGDEIGLHLHMFPDFVEKSGVTPIGDKVWGGGISGYDVLTTAYSYEDMIRILTYAKEVYAKEGLGQPRSYRAGAWFANIDTLKALADTGFLVDTSGRTAYTFGTKEVEGPWDLNFTTKPYFPSTRDQNSPNPPPRLSILEIPNNGADDYAFSKEQMIERFNANYSSGILTEPKQVTYLSHPNWFDLQRQQQMRDIFAYIDRYSNRHDKGPVVYATLSQMYQVFAPIQQ
jgi:hypothetical protein